MSQEGLAGAIDKLENEKQDLAAVKFQLGLKLDVAIKKTTTYINANLVGVACVVVSFIILFVGDWNGAKKYLSWTVGGGAGASTSSSMTATLVLHGLIGFAGIIALFISFIWSIISILKLGTAKETFGVQAIRGGEYAESFQAISNEAGKMKNYLIASLVLILIEAILASQDFIISLIFLTLSTGISIMVMKGRNKLREFKNEKNL